MGCIALATLARSFPDIKIQLKQTCIQYNAVETYHYNIDIYERRMIEQENITTWG